MKIHIVNAHWNNRGDEAALCTLIHKIFQIGKRSKKDITISIVFKETEAIKDFPYEGLVDYFVTKYRPSERLVKAVILNKSKCTDTDMCREMECLEKADIVVYAPGGCH